MVLIRSIKNNFNHAKVARCADRGCELRVNNLKNYVILKGEKVSDERICDCIIFVKQVSTIIGIVELKSKTVHVTEVREKLMNGSRVALDILRSCSNNSDDFEFYLLVLAKRWSASEHRTLTKHSTNIEGRRHHILTKRCGDSFSSIISSLR